MRIFLILAILTTLKHFNIDFPDGFFATVAVIGAIITSSVADYRDAWERRR